MDQITNKNYATMTTDYQTMKNLLTQYKALGGVLPLPISKAFSILDIAYNTGENFEAAFKSACLEMGNFLSSNEEYCARYAGFKNKKDMNNNQSTQWEKVDNYDICMVRNYYRTVSAQKIKKVLNIGDPKSFMSVFTSKTKQQIWGLLNTWIGDKGLKHLTN